MGKFCDPASYNNNACRSRDTLGQVPKAEGFWCGCNPPTRGSTSCLGTFPLGPIKYAVGRPRKMGKCNGAKEIDYALLTEPLLYPVLFPPAPKFLGFTADPFCGDVEQVCLGKGVGGRRWAHLNLRRMGEKAGERARTCPGFESLSDVMVGGHEYISDPQGALSIQQTPQDRPRTSTDKTSMGEREKRTTLRLIVPSRLARCLRNRDAT